MPTIQYLTHIEFGSGAVELLPRALQDLGIRRPLLVTDAGLVRAGILDRVLDLLPGPVPTVFDETPAR